MVLITPAYTDLYSSLEDIPRFNFSTEQIINQAPRTNVGIVSLPTGEYTNPRSDIARSLLNYGPNAKDTSGPAGMGSAPSLIRDSDGNVIRNTELNPFNPSSQFFPYEPDYAGIMSTKAYLEDKGFPLTADPKIEPRAAGQIEETGGYGFYAPGNQEYFVTSDTGAFDPFKVIIEDAGNIYINPYSHRAGLDTKEVRDTIFHEGKHYFIDKYGQAIPITKGAPYETDARGKRGGQHGAIYFADIFRNDPFYYNYYMGATDKGAALGFMEMHNYAKNVLKKAEKEDKTISEILNEDAQDAFRNQQKKNVDEIKEEVKSGGGGPAGMFGTPTGTGQTGGPAGMGSAPPSNNPTGFGTNIRIGLAKGGLASINHLTRGL